MWSPLGSALLALAAATLGCGAETQTEPQIEPAPLDWHACLDAGFDCATLEVPNDYASARSGNQQIAVARVPAGEPARRLGVLLYNLGGPGVPGVDPLGGFHAFLSQVAPELVARFDLVAFDPRGIGRSRPALSFLHRSTIEAFRALDPTPDDDAERAAQDSVADEMRASAEQVDPVFLRHVDTESVARDMERLRKALGESSLNYYGGSYGTLLGAVYATLFPERVGAFVLDSAVMPALDRRELMLGQAAGYEHAFQAFLEHCEASPDCPLGALGAARESEEAIRALIEAADEEPLAVGDRFARGSDLLIAITAVLDSGGGSFLEQSLAQLLAGDASAFLSVADAWYGSSESGADGNDIVAANLAISAVDADYPDGFSRAEFDALVEREVVPQSALFGPMLAEVERTFIEWPFVRSRPLPTIRAPRARPLLVLAGSGDPATPAPWSAEMREALGNGSALVTLDAVGHGQLVRSQCVRDLAVPFLLDPSSLPADTTCDLAPEE